MLWSGINDVHSDLTTLLTTFDRYWSFIVKNGEDYDLYLLKYF